MIKSYKTARRGKLTFEVLLLVCRQRITRLLVGEEL